jgi:cystathionine beta-lyase/cystathionine gamma-synthase
MIASMSLAGEWEENLAYAEGGGVETAVTFATGMAAISAALSVMVAAREEIVAHHILYGCTFSLLTHWLPRCGIKTRFGDLTVEGELEKLINDRARVVFFETPTNPNLGIIDIARVKSVLDAINAERPEQKRITMIVDNTFATPYCQRPIRYGADPVVHSLTKDIGGFGADMGGVVIAPQSLYNHLLLYRKDFGGVLSPKSAWIFWSMAFLLWPPAWSISRRVPFGSPVFWKNTLRWPEFVTRGWSLFLSMSWLDIKWWATTASLPLAA